MKSNKLNKNLKKSRNFLKKNCDILCNLLKNELSDYVEFVKPCGGYFVWIKLKSPYKASELLKRAKEYKLDFTIGDKLSLSDEFDEYIRLSFSYYESKDYEIGVKRLKDLFENYKKNELVPKIAILGYEGKLGKRIIEVASTRNDIIFSEGIDKTMNIKNVKDREVILDVSDPIATNNLLNKLLKLEIYVPLIIGTTGDLPIENIIEYSKKAPVAVIPNFSNGINQIIKFIDKIDEDNWNISIEERHSINKKDTPSGTAVMIEKSFNKDIPIISIREGEIVSDHKIKLDNNMETIEINHLAKSIDLYANGAIDFVKWIEKQPPGYYTSK